MDLTVFENDEPRIQDLQLAGMLAYARPRDIRELIQRNREELESYGSLPCHTALIEAGKGAHLEAREYWLSEAQSLLLTMKSGTQRAAECRRELIHLFQAWRHGRLAPREAGQVTLSTVRCAVREEMEPLRLELAEVRGNVAFLGKRIDDIVPRRDFPEPIKQQFRFIASRRYQGDCPCCRNAKVVDVDASRLNGAHYEHFNGRERNRVEDGWIVCAKCNWRLENDQEFKEQTGRPRFRVFQADLKELCLPPKTRMKRAVGIIADLFTP